MKSINFEDIRTIKGISIYQVLKSLANEQNYTDEDFEFDIPKKKTNHTRYYRKNCK